MLTLPGEVFIYQGDEIGIADGPAAEPPVDRAGRDIHRNPMPWTPEPNGGFSTATPWLPPALPSHGSVAEQRGDPGSLLHLYHRLIALRCRLAPRFELLDAAPDVLAYRRGRYLVALNFAAEERPAPEGGGQIELSTTGREGRSATLSPNEGVIFTA